MVNTRFAGSNGLLDVPAPLWIEEDEQLFGHWGSLLLAMIKQGSVESLRRGDTIEFASNEFGLMIDGGIYVTDQPESKEPRTLLIQFLRRGDIFSSAIGGNLNLQLQAHCRTTCLIIREPVLEAFQCEFPLWDRVFPKLTTGMFQAYSRAVCDTMGRDQDRIHRVLTMLANHPTALDSKLGREIEANKQQIRDLAGVQKRSATRAFRALEESSAVSFYGYKRLFFRGVNSE